ncbi:alanine dehydrogenase [Metallumcola ferriviriculae]|uniref:Alanine dehydrogenase n=1 Tax=Metallumcola ferriviriculae TaxID=3039180 RepID=A0AAU0UPG7_9FIRM|nr:alanine dehydrogenase [Desulfitibacteraceae bacterium MK1]
MIIGIPKEIKNNENRVAITPAGVEALVANNHQVIVEENAGMGSGFNDGEYKNAGAEVAAAADVFSHSEMIMKVKEPQPEEYDLFQEGQILFTYLHAATGPELIKTLLAKKVVGISYDTVQLENGALPLLAPMSEVAGRMSVQIGAQFLEKPKGGRGVLLAGVPGVPAANVVIVGGGVVGTNAAKMAVGMGARVTILDINPDRLMHLDDLFGSKVQTLMSNSFNIEQAAKTADLLIGAVLLPGARAPQLVTEAMVKQMNFGAVIVDVAIDQGGCIETIDRITTHDQPTYTKHGVLHYAVANMPGAVPRTSTFALTNATMPYALNIANKGYLQAVREDLALAKGLNVCAGKVTHPVVADGLGYPFEPIV